MSLRAHYPPPVGAVVVDSKRHCLQLSARANTKPVLSLLPDRHLWPRSSPFPVTLTGGDYIYIAQETLHRPLGGNSALGRSVPRPGSGHPPFGEEYPGACAKSDGSAMVWSVLSRGSEGLVLCAAHAISFDISARRPYIGLDAWFAVESSPAWHPPCGRLCTAMRGRTHNSNCDSRIYPRGERWTMATDGTE